ncbi:hypothetical protein [Clostridium algidicarnis]|uniref:hypothetical protein n=1 Tax=Clostridium algidicarnis TaxID=37659 RepID=UPI001625BA7D|nr:hypothetical protein [Clostridium algidicarnis]MBB6697279.1 hypothetical protein [Clostridium algidicarnis]
MKIGSKTSQEKNGLIPVILEVFKAQLGQKWVKKSKRIKFKIVFSGLELTEALVF